MKLITFMRIILRHWRILLFTPLVAAIAVFLLLGRSPKQYKSSMQLYTGFGSGSSLMSTGARERYDYYAVNNAFDNLINTISSDAVLQKVALSLFAQSLIHGSDESNRFISPRSYIALRDFVPDSIMALIDKTSIEKSVENLEASMDGAKEGFVYKLLNLYHPHYSLWALREIKLKKLGSSDLIEISYTTDDPALCYQTLRLLSENFMGYYRQMRFGDTDDVVEYFEEQLARSGDRLRSSEDDYMDYSKKNRVINYYEQTKAIAGQLQAFELNYDKILALDAQSARSAELLGNKIGLKLLRRLEAGDVLDKRHEIASRVSSAVTDNVFRSDTTYTGLDMSRFHSMVEESRGELHDMLDTVAANSYTAEGIAVDNIVDQWLTHTIARDAVKEAIRVMDSRRKEIDAMFDFYAPIGAVVKRKEREINVNEEEYLSLLHSLTLAKLRKQDVEISSSTLKVAEDPLFPISAEPSGRKMLVLVTLLAVFILLLAIVLIMEFSDRTMRTVAVAERLSGLTVMGVYPAQGQGEDEMDRQILSKSVNRFMGGIFSLRAGKALPTVINLLSLERREGKTTILQQIHDSLESMGYSSVVQNFSNYQGVAKEYLEFTPPESISDFVIIEHPSLQNQAVNYRLLQGGVNLLVVRANRAWHDWDNRVVRSLHSAIGSTEQLYILLNGTEYSCLEDLLGELPYRRSSFRRFVKRMVYFEFSSKRKL